MDFELSFVSMFLSLLRIYYMRSLVWRRYRVSSESTLYEVFQTFSIPPYLMPALQGQNSLEVTTPCWDPAQLSSSPIPMGCFHGPRVDGFALVIGKTGGPKKERNHDSSQASATGELHVAFLAQRPAGGVSISESFEQERSQRYLSTPAGSPLIRSEP